ncbi:expressed unknown protein [Seminavis robusta]|uniref:CRAL-TRIO domain-containing protein n=1 Tax=Seminavis robusta TaxID=568900 RepID=A0A9N8EVZ5_9STRA|nr:expressed unknown protein [Seminavis robusta]|eukprot:Sro1850_g301580.1 n/a (281) ;mRNA; f:5267-6212
MAQPPPPPAPPDKMSLTQQELDWCLALKQAVLEDDELEERPDLDYAHCALMARGNLSEALHRFRSLQEFRSEYQIHDDDPLEAWELLQQFFEQQPWFILDVNVGDETVFVQDFSRLDPKAVDLPRDWRVFMGGFYYLLRILQPNIDIMRKGIVVIAELANMGWKNFDIEFMNRHHYHLMAFYPIQIKEVTFMHASTIGSMLHSMLKRLRGNRDEILVGCQFEQWEGEWSDMFKTPSPELAQQRLNDKIKRYLVHQYHNNITFRFPGEEALMDSTPPPQVS